MFNIQITRGFQSHTDVAISYGEIKKIIYMHAHYMHITFQENLPENHYLLINLTFYIQDVTQLNQ